MPNENINTSNSYSSGNQNNKLVNNHAKPSNEVTVKKPQSVSLLQVRPGIIKNYQRLSGFFMKLFKIVETFLSLYILLFQCYKQTWKAAANHFQRYSDIRPRDERKPTVVDLANQPHVTQKVNGWKIYHLSSQIEELVRRICSFLCKILVFINLYNYFSVKWNLKCMTNSHLNWNQWKLIIQVLTLIVSVNY